MKLRGISQFSTCWEGSEGPIDIVMGGSNGEGYAHMEDYVEQIRIHKSSRIVWLEISYKNLQNVIKNCLI